MNNETTNTTSQVKGLVQAALFAALIILMAMVPFFTILFTGRNSGGICKHFNLFCAENSDRGCSLLCISWSQKGDDKMESIPKYSTFCGRDQRSAHKHIACYEYDLFLF